jgi:periplasmic protein TonB
MFEQATLSSGPTGKRVATTILGVTGQAMVVTFLILVPMIWPEVLPAARAFVTIVPPPPAFKPPPPPGSTSVQPRARGAAAKIALPWQPPTQPRFVPTGVAKIDDADLELAMTGPAFPGSQIPGATYSSGPGVFGGSGTSPVIPPPSPRPPDPPQTKQPTTTRIVQTSELDPAQILKRVAPVYPEMAKRMRVSGTVELRGIIGTDGHIRELKVLGGHPLLVKAAVDAVSQWIYKPTRLTGQPVEVDAPILVIFRLN